MYNQLDTLVDTIFTSAITKANIIKDILNKKATITATLVVGTATPVLQFYKQKSKNIYV